MDINVLRGDASASFVMADEQGHIIEASSGFCRNFGWDEAPLIGKPLTVLIPEALHDAHNMGFSRHLETGERTILDTPLDLEIVTGKGQVVTALHTITTAEADGANVFFAVIVPR